MIKAHISHFTSNYSHLNSNDKDIPISLFDLARCIVTVGQQNYRTTASQGFFRIGELILKTFANVEKKNSYLQLTDTFWNLEKSEKATVSYQLGMGFTKAISEKLLNIPWLIHLDKYQGNIQINRRGKNLSKVILYHSRNYFQRPDLIGFDFDSKPHIFEAKGISTQYDKQQIQDAIDQVSQINTINGDNPETRVACCLNMSSNPITARIVDPADNFEKGIKIKIEKREILKNYYSTFLLDERWYDSQSININNLKFQIRPIGEPSIYYGINSDILKIIRKKDLFDHLKYWQNENKSHLTESLNENFSIGQDGTILLNKYQIQKYL